VPSSSCLAEASERPARLISPRSEAIKIFNGKSLDGLYTWLEDSKYQDAREVFRVSDGNLVISGDGLGAVITRDAYFDYHLVLEYRWGSRTWGERKNSARDSGLLIHSTGAEGGYRGIWMPSLEVQIIEGGVGDFIRVGGPDETGEPVRMVMSCEVEEVNKSEVRCSPGAPRLTYDSSQSSACPRVNGRFRDPEWQDALGFRGKQDPDSPSGVWTRLDVICDGGHVQVFVNGVMVNEAFDVMPRAGKIQFQSELAEIQVRRWELWPLKKGPRPAAPKIK
jgi:hypothetical protein